MHCRYSSIMHYALQDEHTGLAQSPVCARVVHTEDTSVLQKLAKARREGHSRSRDSTASIAAAAAAGEAAGREGEVIRSGGSGGGSGGSGGSGGGKSGKGGMKGGTGSTGRWASKLKKVSLALPSRRGRKHEKKSEKRGEEGGEKGGEKRRKGKPRLVAGEVISGGGAVMSGHVTVIGEDATGGEEKKEEEEDEGWGGGEGGEGRARDGSRDRGRSRQMRPLKQQRSKRSR
jgi:hypothetical protein